MPAKRKVNGQRTAMPGCRRVILDSLLAAKTALTASEVKTAIHSKDSNATRTRLNELCRMGLAVKVGLKVDPTSRKRVASWKAVAPGEVKLVALPPTRRSQLAKAIAERNEAISGGLQLLSERDALVNAFEQVAKAHPELADELLSHIPA